LGLFNSLKKGGPKGPIGFRGFTPWRKFISGRVLRVGMGPFRNLTALYFLTISRTQLPDYYWGNLRLLGRKVFPGGPKNSPFLGVVRNWPSKGRMIFLPFIIPGVGIWAGQGGVGTLNLILGRGGLPNNENWPGGSGRRGGFTQVR